MNKQNIDRRENSTIWQSVHSVFKIQYRTEWKHRI